jgi:hypothetical protein
VVYSSCVLMAIREHEQQLIGKAVIQISMPCGGFVLRTPIA